MTVNSGGGRPSSMRVIPDGYSAEATARIDATLEAITREQRVTIPLAIESGSRAWGFPSPDSDFDCRFVYLRPVDDYLTPWLKRDVIESPLEGEFDVNGWDLAKALKLMLKGNAVIIEWLRSPIVYRGNAAFRDELLDLAHRFVYRELIGRHYLHLGERQRRTYFGDGKDVVLKKLFYALRPAAALRWLRLRPGEAIAPMHFPTLMAESDPPAQVLRLVQELVERKAETRELGSAPLPEAIACFVDEEFRQARDVFERTEIRISGEARDAAAGFFQRWTRYYG